jgi:hypothetical protein
MAQWLRRRTDEQGVHRAPARRGLHSAGIKHSIRNNGLTDLTFIVVTTPVEDR